MASAPPSRRLVLRADGNARIGLGHVVRLLALGEALRQQFEEVIFVGRSVAEMLAEPLGAGLLSEVRELPAELPLAEEPAWLTRHVLRPAADVLVLDGYNFGFAYQQALRPATFRLACLDDLHAFPFAADLVLNPAGGVPAAAYEMRPPHARLLTGPAYAPLRSAFQPNDAAAAPSPHAVLLCLGGADPTGQTQRLAAELLALPAVAEVHAVAGAAYAGWDALRTWATGQPRLHLHRNLPAPALAALMRRCGAALLSPSTVSYEYCAAGGGLLLLHPTADNQRGLDHFLRGAGLALPAATAPNVLTAAEAPRLAAQLRQAQRRHFDGQAAQRLRQEFAAVQLPPLSFRLRPAAAADSDVLFAWANDPLARQQSFNPAPIPRPDHEAWLAARLAAPAQHLLLVAEDEASGAPVGTVRFALAGDNDVATLSYSLDAGWRGRGLAAPLLVAGARAALAHFAAARAVRGEVRPDNAASVRAFRRAGFGETTPSGGATHLAFEWVGAMGA